jgi:hypothetical protein
MSDTSADISRPLEVELLLVKKPPLGARPLPEVPLLLALTSDHAVSHLHTLFRR